MQHRFLAERYTYQTSATGREAYVQEFATRWSEFARLPYFNMVQMIVIDPMHNLLLGESIRVCW